MYSLSLWVNELKIQFEYLVHVSLQITSKLSTCELIINLLNIINHVYLSMCYNYQNVLLFWCNSYQNYSLLENDVSWILVISDFRAALICIPDWMNIQYTCSSSSTVAAVQRWKSKCNTENFWIACTVLLFTRFI